MRLCADCFTDITGRGSASARCEPCAADYRRDYYRNFKRSQQPTVATREEQELRRAPNHNRHRVDRQSAAVPVVQPLDMTPARVVTVEGQQFEVAWSGGAGLSSVGARGSALIEGRGSVRRNGALIMSGVL